METVGGLTAETIGRVALAVLPGIIVALVTLYIARRSAKQDWLIWKGGIDEFRKNVETAIREIRDDIKEIRGQVVAIFEKMGASTTKTESPITLTDLGIEISHKLGVRSWASTKSRELESETPRQNPIRNTGVLFRLREE